MAERRRILLATDGTSSSETATAEAVRIAAVQGARLVVVCAAGRGAERTLAARVSSVLADAEARAAAAGVPCETVVAEGAPSECIPEVAAACDAGLVVVGTHDRGPVGRLLNGSVSRSVLRHCERPVLVVHPMS